MMNFLSNSEFHLVSLSPWPLMCSLNLFTFIVNLIDLSVMNGSFWMFFYSFFSLLFSVVSWFISIHNEALMGEHTLKVKKSLKIAFIIFIVSEVMLFFSFFWALLDYTLCYSIELGNWPPVGVQPINPWEIPLLNTLLLSASSVSITWCHNALISNNKKSSINGLMVTIILAFIFLWIQFKEFLHAQFTIADSVYGSIFFTLTGFHGFHVLIGMIFLCVQLYRLLKNYYSWNDHVGLETSIWYWHFVDLIWFSVFILVYFWSSY